MDFVLIMLGFVFIRFYVGKCDLLKCDYVVTSFIY